MVVKPAGLMKLCNPADVIPGQTLPLAPLPELLQEVADMSPAAGKHIYARVLTPPIGKNRLHHVRLHSQRQQHHLLEALHLVDKPMFKPPGIFIFRVPATLAGESKHLVGLLTPYDDARSGDELEPFLELAPDNGFIYYAQP
ncbi:hypothetical protein ES705_26689 [subsurface metagenome]